MKTKYATKIKILIRYQNDKGYPRKINLPKLRFTRLARLVRLALRLSYKPKVDLDIETLYNAIYSIEEVLSTLPPFEVVHIESPKDNTYVDIYTC